MPTPTESDDQPINPLIEARRNRAKPKRRRGRGWRIAGVVVVLGILFGFFGLPPIIRSQAIKRMPEFLGGRAVAIEKIRINPLTLSTTIEGLAISNLDGSPFVGWSRLYVNFDSFSIFTGQWRFQAVELDGFDAHVSLDEAGVPNFQDLIPMADPAAVEPAEPAAKPRPLYVGRLAVGDAKVEFKDNSQSRAFATNVGPISFELKRFNTSGDARAPYQFAATTESGERFAWTGNVSLEPISSQGHLTLADIRLTKYTPYHAAFHNASLLSGLLDISGSYVVDLSGDTPRATFTDGAITLRKLSVAVRDAEAPFLDVERLALTGISADLATNTARIDRISVEGGHAHLQRAADGSIDALAILPTPPADSATAGNPTAAPALPLPDFTLGELSVANFSVDVDDLATPRPAHTAIESINFTLADFALLKLEKKLPLSLHVKFATGGTVDLVGEAALQPLAAAAHLTVADFALTPFSPYIEPFANIRLAGGIARTSGSVLFENNVATFSGEAGLDQLVTLDPVESVNFFTMTSIALNGISFHSDPLALHLDEIIITEPSASLLVNADGTLNLQTILNIAPTPEGAPESEPVVTLPTQVPAPAEAAPLPDITVGKIELRGAKFGYEDRSIQPASRTAITLEGTITGLSSAELARADVNLTGKVDDSAPIAITGKLNPLGKPAYSKLTIDFTGIDLPAAVSPYMGKFAGYELARGRLTLDIDFDLQDRKISSSNVITLDQFTFGPRTNSPDATKLPVSLAIALLKDSSGQIVLDVPVKGSLDDPKFKIGRVVWRVITNILVKAATSPFSLLGAAFGGGGDELAYQLLQPGAVQPTAEELKKLETVSKALIARPALQLDIQGNTDSISDRQALQRDRLQAQLRNRLWEQLRTKQPDLPAPDQLTITPEQNAELLLAMYAEAFPAAEGAIAPVMAAPDGALLATPAAAPTETTTRSTGRRFGPRASGVNRSFSAGTVTASTVAESSVVMSVPAGTPGAPTELMTADGVPVLTPEAAFAKLVATIEVTDDDLRALADARAQAVRTWLIGPGQVPAERVFIIASGAKGPRVDFNLR